MNMKNLVLSFAILTSVLSFAQQREDRNLRGERKRVAQGIKSGEIKPREAIAIEKQARDVKQAKRSFADGQITVKERAKIARQDKQLDRTINRKKHN
jgi:hypothetical protein